MTAVRLDADIEGALGRVLDPCSIAAGNPISLLDMGLVQDWEVTGDEIRVRICVTSPTCTMAPHFVAAAERELEQIDGIRRARVEIDTRVFWTEDMMRPLARAERHARIRARAQAAGIRPQPSRRAAG